MTRLTRRTSWKKILIAGAIGVTVFGMTAPPVFAAENIFQKVQRSVSERFEKLYLQVIPGDKPGKLVIKQMSAASQNLKSFTGDTKVDVEMIGGGQTIGSASLTATGPTVVGELWNPQTYKQEMTLKGQFTVQGTTLSAAADVKMIDGISYIKINQLPAMPGMDLTKLTGTWIKVDPAAQGVQPEEIKMTAEQMQKMQDAFNKMINSTDAGTAKAEKKDGNNVYVVTVTVSKPAVVEYFATVSEVQKEMMSKMADTDEEKAMLVQQDPAEMKKSLESVLNSMGDIKATFWVDRGNYYPRHFELPLEIDVKTLAAQSKAAQSLSTSAAAGAKTPEVEKVKLNVVSTTTDFNKQFTITAPEGAEDAQMFFGKVMGSMGGPGMVPGTTPSMMRQPAVGTTELPTLTPAQKKQLEEYEKMTGTPLPMMYR